MYEELLKLARQTLEAHFEGKKIAVSEEIKKKYGKKQACFVTLTKNKELRGCIGCLEPHQELYKDVMDNAINAGFQDFRFMPLNEKELKETNIEISVLSVPKKLEHKDSADLLKKINNKMGIVLRKGIYSATFLPQVWEQIPNKKEFLEHLSRKAGLQKDEWKDAEIYWYNIENAEERQKHS